MRGNNNLKPYVIINWTFAAICVLIFLYAALHDPEKSNYPLHSSYEVITNENSISTGLSRSFSALVRFRIAAADDYNPYGLRIFLFFVIQFFLRITILMLIQGRIIKARRSLIMVDSLQSVALFLICFGPFLVYWIETISALGS